MNASQPELVGAAGRFVPVGFYDAIVAAGMRERAWRPVLAEQVRDVAGAHGSVVEIGAGTGALTRMLRAAVEPGVEVHAVEPDRRASAIARRQGRADGVDWIEGSAFELPFAAGSQDAVVFALVMHHLLLPEKRHAMAEARRVLRPGGRLLIADFGRPHDVLMALAFQVIRLADGRATTAFHTEDVVRDEMVGGGFEDVRELCRVRTGGGTLELLRGVQP